MAGVLLFGNLATAIAGCCRGSWRRWVGGLPTWRRLNLGHGPLEGVGVRQFQRFEFPHLRRMPLVVLT
jgi:hypothetical protein